MNYGVITEPQAESDVAEAYRWIAKESPVNAARWTQSIQNAMNSLEHFPQRCPLAPETEAFAREIRQLVYGNYRILFTIQATTVYVLHVRHGARRHLRPNADE